MIAMIISGPGAEFFMIARMIAVIVWGITALVSFIIYLDEK